MVKPRQQRILAWVDRVGAGSYQELAQALQVSAMTVRREVDMLSGQGLIIKTLGGVQRAGAPACLLESAVQGRIDHHRQEKQAIARAAIDLLQGADTLFLDGSTTCLELAKLIARRLRGVTIVTNSVLAAMELGRNRNNTVIGLGGEFDAASCCFVGSTAEETAERYYVDIALMSTMGFLPREGTFESIVANFRLKQGFSRRARQSMLLVDHSKFGQRALAKVLPTHALDYVVTDAATGQEHLDALSEAGVKVIRAIEAEGQNVA